jgi:hypothetical protein
MVLCEGELLWEMNGTGEENAALRPFLNRIGIANFFE